MAELQAFDDTFNLPVLAFLEQIVRERFPDLDFRKGSALYRAVLVPASLFWQPYRDRVSVIRRNQSLRFYQYMRDSELDKLVANFFIERQPSNTASGTARVYFSQPDGITIPADAVFATTSGLQFLPVTAFSFTAAEVILNQEEGLFFVDIPVVAIAPGSDYAIVAESLFSVSNVPNAVRVTNKTAFANGKDVESNVDLVNRTKSSLASRTLTSRNSIMTVLNEAFPTLIISQEVIGFGDEEMIRDVVRAYSSYDELFTTSFCRKFNVAYDPTTRSVYTGSGSPPANYLLRGAMVDVGNTYSNIADGGNPYFWFEIESTREGQVVLVTVQRGDTVLLNTSDIADPDAGTYVIEDVLFTTPFSTTSPPAPPDRNEETHLLIFDRALVNPQGPGGFDPRSGEEDLTLYKYTINSGVRTDQFHVGGAADVFIHSTGEIEDQITISKLYASSIAPNFFDIPVSSTPIDNPGFPGTPLYEDGKAFLLPVVNIIRVEQLDPSNADVVLKTLVQGVDFFYIVTDPEVRFTPEEAAFLRFIDTDPAGINYTAARMRVTYESNTDIVTIQEFVDQSTVHDTTKSVLVKAAQPVQLDVQLAFRGEATASQAADTIRSYILGIPQGGSVSVNDVVAVLNLFGVNDIVMPVTLVKNTFNVDGSVTEEESQDRLEVSALQRFVPVDTLSITKSS